MNPIESVARRPLPTLPACLGALLLGACATPNPSAPTAPSTTSPATTMSATTYRNVEAGRPQARLLMRGDVSGEERYTVIVLAPDCRAPQVVGTGTAKTNPALRTIAADGTPATVGVLFTRPDKTRCQITWSFAPRDGRSYLIAAKYLPDSCTARLIDATDPDALRPEPTAVRRDGGGKFCTPLTETQRQRLGTSAVPATTGQRPAPGTERDAELGTRNVTDDALKDLIGGTP